MRRNVGASAGTLAVLGLMMFVAGPRNQGTGGPGQNEQSAMHSQSESGPKSEKNEATSSNPRHLEGPWLATRPFFQHDSHANVSRRNGQAVDLFDEESVVKCAEDVDCETSIREYFGATKGNYSVESVIATVADPLHTRLALLTDATINAIEEGAASSGWEFASEWLPWNDSVNSDVGDVAKRREQRAMVREQETQPGVLVFRHQKQGPTFDNRVLIVFVLGEAPTGGVSPTQFHLARAYAKAMEGKGPVRVLGPMFSGSFYSLTKLVEWDENEFKTRPSDYVIRTGTATSNDNGEALKVFAPDFDGTNESLTDQQTHFCEVIGELNISPGSAAFLVEGETGYGNSFTANVSDSTKSDSTKKVKRPGCPGVRVFRFPREISHLRNAYREAIAASQSNNTQVPDVSFSLKDSNSGEDSVPLFSGTQTPLSQNAVLAEITSEIRRNEIRIVEAGASNVLDLLFVARVLREQCPDTRVLVVFPDLLFVQALQTEPLTGVLSLSTYPLFSSRDLWTKIARPNVTYTDMNSEGVYNALLLLLERSGEKTDYDRARSAVADYSWKSLKHPPTWLMTLDRNGFSPVNVLTNPRHTNWFEELPEGINPLILPRPPVAWTSFLVPLSLFSLWLAGLIVYLRRYTNSRVMGFLSPDRHQAVDSARLFFVFLCFLLLSTLQFIVYSPVAFHRTLQPLPVVQVFAWLGMLVAAALALAIGIQLARKPRLAIVRTVLVASALMCACALLLWMWCCYGRGDQSFFFSYRSVELQLGSSPIIPVAAVLIAFIVFSAVHLMRFHLITNQRPRLFTTTFDAVLEGQLKKSRGEMNRILLAPIGLYKRGSLMFACAFLVASFVLFLLLRVNIHLATVDGPAYDALSIGLQVSLVLALLLTCWHLKIIWSWFHTFLASLNTLPLAGAFTRLNDGSRRGPIWARRLNLLSLDIPIRSSQTLHDMRILINRNGDVAPGLRASDVDHWFTAYRGAVKKLLSNECASERSGESTDRWAARRDFVYLKHLGASITDEMCRLVLLPHWRENCIIISQSNEKAPKKEAEGEESGSQPGGEPAPSLKTFYDLAQSFVALHYSAFALYGVRQIQNLLWFLSLGFVLLTVSLNSYSYQSPRLIGRFLVVLFLAISYVGWRCLAEMERNPILSRISGSTAGELNKGFYLKLVSYGALPVLGILASQFPSISKFLFPWVQPALEALR